MAHLKCQEHHQRVCFTPEDIMHRNGNGGGCSSDVFIMGRHSSNTDGRTGEPYKLTRDQVLSWAQNKAQ